jgi:hypothetical protein
MGPLWNRHLATREIVILVSGVGNKGKIRRGIKHSKSFPETVRMYRADWWCTSPVVPVLGNIKIQSLCTYQINRVLIT